MPHIHPINCPFRFDDLHLPITRPTPLTTTNGIQIKSAIFPKNLPPDRQTDWQRWIDRLDGRQACSNTSLCPIDTNGPRYACVTPSRHRAMHEARRWVWSMSVIDRRRSSFDCWQHLATIDVPSRNYFYFSGRRKAPEVITLTFADIQIS